jgi:hypothetical protein
MERFDSYDKYEEFLEKLTTNRFSKLLNTIMPSRDKSSEPVTFDVFKAAVPYTNSPAKASSTVVRRVRYFPMSKTALVSLGNINSDYPYFMNDMQLAQWMRSNSLGRFYNNYIKRK